MVSTIRQILSQINWRFRFPNPQERRVSGATSPYRLCRLVGLLNLGIYESSRVGVTFKLITSLVRIMRCVAIPLLELWTSNAWCVWHSLEGKCAYGRVEYELHCKLKNDRLIETETPISVPTDSQCGYSHVSTMSTNFLFIRIRGSLLSFDKVGVFWIVKS